MITFGLVVEGSYDEKALPEIIRKFIQTDIKFVPRPIAQKGKFTRFFGTYLEEFRHVNQGTNVDRALVIRDANHKNPEELIRDMQNRIVNRSYPFPVRFHVIVRELETWLLADEEAISRVTRARSGRTVARVQEELESIEAPKERLKRILSNAEVVYTSEVARQIAAESNLETIQYRCPGFGQFRQSLLNV